MSDTEQYSEEHLLTLLKDPSKEREHIGGASKSDVAKRNAVNEKIKIVPLEARQ